MKKEYVKIFYLKRKIIFPNCNMPMILSLSNFTKNLQVGDKLLTFPVRSLFDILFYRKKLATLSEITGLKITDKSVKLNIKGISRVRLKKINRLHMAQYIKIDEMQVDNSEPITESLRKKSQELIFLINVEESDKLISLLNYLVDLDQMTDFISNYFVIDFNSRYNLYRELNFIERSKKLMIILDSLINEIKDKRQNFKND